MGILFKGLAYLMYPISGSSVLTKKHREGPVDSWVYMSSNRPGADYHLVSNIWTFRFGEDEAVGKSNRPLKGIGFSRQAPGISNQVKKKK